MTQKRTLFNASINVTAIYFLLVLAMIGASIYLTSHYFQLHFPEGLTGSATLCNINSYFNCDAASYSALSNIAGVPISVFSLVLAFFFAGNLIFKSEQIEGTHYFLAVLNALGCLFLLFYSIFILKHLCPVCTLYYFLSFSLAYLFFKYSDIKNPSFKILIIYAAITGIVAAIFGYVVMQKEEKIDLLSDSLLKQYYSLPNLGRPKIDSPHRIASATKDFTKAPIHISVFSDFQCPACKMLSEQLPKVVERYQGKLNIEYFFYPLDSGCNPAVKRSIHAYACQAAYLAHCSGENFIKVHDLIFEHQEKLSTNWLNKQAKKLGLTECMNSDKTKKEVVELINQATPFNVRSTPTFLVNGVKIEGVLPHNQLFIILDDIVKKAK